LEQSLLKAISEGLTSTSTLEPEELSKPGRAVLRAVTHLIRNGAETPLTPSAIYITSRKIFGGEKKHLTKYLRSLESITLGSDARAVLQTMRDKDTLVHIVNEAGKQLADGVPNFLHLSGILERRLEMGGRKIESLASLVDKDWPDPPHGPAIRSMQKVSLATNGICGIWALGGYPGIGKSTVALQLAFEMERKMDVLYYDLDGTGTDWFIERGRQIFHSTAKFKEHSKNLYIRTNIETLDQDMMRVQTPAMIVIDSLQTLPTNLSHRRSSLDKWLVSFKAMFKKGFTIILVSELNRDSYREPSMSAFKETGAIEYTCSLGVILDGEPDEEEEPIEFHIVKNRHNKRKGVITELKRDLKKIFWFDEV